jgi:hypothetical protein
MDDSWVRYDGLICFNILRVFFDFFMDIHKYPRHRSWILHGKFNWHFCSGVLGEANLNDPHEMWKLHPKQDGADIIIY